MKISASVSVQHDNIFSPFPGLSWEEGFLWVKQQGCDGVEIILADPNALDADKIAAALSRLNLEASTISTGQAMALEGLSMTSPDDSVREATLRRLKDDIDFSLRLGKPNVTIGLIRGRGGASAPEIEYGLLLQEMQKIAEYAQKHRIVLNLEPINRYECTLINSTDEGSSFLADLGNPENVGLLYDTFHSNIEDADGFEAIRRNLPHISHVHLADSNRRLPGEGHFNFTAALKILRGGNYGGYISLEVLNKPSPEHVRDFAGLRLKNLTADIF